MIGNSKLDKYNYPHQENDVVLVNDLFNDNTIMISYYLKLNKQVILKKYGSYGMEIVIILPMIKEVIGNKKSNIWHGS